MTNASHIIRPIIRPIIRRIINDATSPGSSGSGGDLRVRRAVLTDPETLEIRFNRAVQFGADADVPVLTTTGGAVVLTYVSGEFSNTLIYSTDRSIGDEETVTLAYTQPGDGIQDADGNLLASFSGKLVLGPGESPDSGFVFVYHADGRQVAHEDGRSLQVPDTYANS